MLCTDTLLQVEPPAHWQHQTRPVAVTTSDAATEFDKVDIIARKRKFSSCG